MGISRRGIGRGSVVGGIFLIFFAALMFAVGIIMVINNSFDVIEIKGVIEEIVDLGDDFHEVYVNYVFEGVSYEHISLGEYSSTWEIGESITLLINPNDPTSITSNVVRYIPYALFLFGTIAAVFSVINFVGFSRYRKEIRKIKNDDGLINADQNPNEDIADIKVAFSYEKFSVVFDSYERALKDDYGNILFTMDLSSSSAVSETICLIKDNKGSVMRKYRLSEFYKDPLVGSNRAFGQLKTSKFVSINNENCWDYFESKNYCAKLVKTDSLDTFILQKSKTKICEIGANFSLSNYSIGASSSSKEFKSASFKLLAVRGYLQDIFMMLFVIANCH